MEQFSTLNKDKEYVVSLQQEVGVVADGVYGPNTHSAVRQYYGMPIMMQKKQKSTTLSNNLEYQI